MNEAQLLYWRNRITPKLSNQRVLVELKLDTRLHEPWQQWPELQGPWLWTGSKNPRNKRGYNPQAQVRSPGLPVFPRNRSCVVHAHRVIYHLLLGPLDPKDSLRYRAHQGGIHDQPNVNPLHHRHVGFRGFRYEHPTYEEMGIMSPREEIQELLRDGYTVEQIRDEIGFTQSQIDEVRAMR